MNRRGFLQGLLASGAALTAGPVIKVIEPPLFHSVAIRTNLPPIYWRKFYQGIPIIEVDYSLEKIQSP